MIIHLIHYPVSARRFVEPLVKSLNAQGIPSELWLENKEGFQEFTAAIDCPKRFARFDLSANPVVVLVRLLRLYARLLKSKPEAVHAHQTRAAFIPLLAALLARVPIRIYHTHGTPYLGYRGPLRAALWLLEFLNCRFATHVVAVAHSIRRKMIQHRIVGPSKCTVLGEGSACGIDLAEFSADQFDEQHKGKSRQELGIAADAYMVLYVGRPFRRKGFHVLLAAWQNVVAADSRDVLLIAGCTQADVVKAMGEPVRGVHAFGYRSDLRVCYAACDVVVLPSFHEGFGYSLLEGAAAARPLVGTDIPGIDSIVTRENGLLVPPGDGQALAEALLALKKDGALRQRMGHASRQYVEQCFDRRNFGRFMVDYYHQIGIGGNGTTNATSVRS